MMSNQGYNDKLDPEDQVDMEESIAAKIFSLRDSDDVWAWSRNPDPPRSRPRMTPLYEEDCAQLGREILLLVLSKFRTDLVTNAKRI